MYMYMIIKYKPIELVISFCYLSWGWYCTHFCKIHFVHQSKIPVAHQYGIASDENKTKTAALSLFHAEKKVSF